MTKAVTMFCGQLDGELRPQHISFRADSVRWSIGKMFVGTVAEVAKRGDTAHSIARGAWAVARRQGWRVVKVRVEALPDNSPRACRARLQKLLRGSAPWDSDGDAVF